MTTGLTTKMSCGSVYVSPAVRTVELQNEGVFCISVFDAYNFTETFEREPWEELNL